MRALVYVVSGEQRAEKNGDKMGTLLAIHDQFVYNSKHTSFLVNFFTGEDFRRITNANARQLRCPKRPSAQTPFSWVTVITLNGKLGLSSLDATSVSLFPTRDNILDCPFYLRLQIIQWSAGDIVEDRSHPCAGCTGGVSRR